MSDIDRVFEGDKKHKTLMSNIFKENHFVWSLIMFFSPNIVGKTHPNAYLLFDRNIGEYNRLLHEA